ncbi:MAG: hypothetical protein IPI81_12565 [Flavobacteriales bacterium]|nr:hypothetical protein [Flavobacteriales bacterium]MCC6939236.1 hypothetical protein [Flavobacteriales bacterium]
MDKDLTPEQSLKVIESMIGQAKKSFSRMSFYFLLWGVLLIVAMAATYLLRNGSEAFSQGASWGIAGLIGGILSSIHGAREGRRQPVNNPMDRVIGWIWGAFVITMMIVIAASVSNHQDPGGMITLLTGFATFLTGQIMRFKPLIIGGVLFWIAGLAMHFTNDPLTLTALYCGSMFFGYIIPGLMLKNQEDGLRTA